ncbi:MAG: hypothetical protein GY773_17495, partial [Actinomycetia bacterium]|nr:hypothetical protein [Actinomycetes bacterium]
SRLVTLDDLLNLGVTLIAADGVTVVEEPGEADFVDLQSLLNQHAHSLADAMDMGFVSESEFNQLTSFTLTELTDAGFDVSALVDDPILLGDLIASTDVSISALDLVTAGLLTDSDLGSFDPTTLISVGTLESLGIIPENALDGLGLTELDDISLEQLLGTDLVDVDVMDLVAESLLGGGDIISGLGDILGEDLMFEGFDLYDLVDMGMLEHSDIVGFEYDLLNIKDREIELDWDAGDILELGFSTIATVLVSVEAGFEWVVDFNGVDDEGGFDFLIKNAQISGRAELELEDLELAARLGFIELTVGGPDVGHGPSGM